MPLGHLPGEVFRACPTGKRPWGRPRTRWRDYVSRLAWERLGVPPEELEVVSGEREVGRLVVFGYQANHSSAVHKLDDVGGANTVVGVHFCTLGLGPMSAEVEWQLRSWGSQVELVEMEQETSPSLSLVLSTDSDIPISDSGSRMAISPDPEEDISALMGKSYMAAGHAGASLHTMAVLQAYKADLLNSLNVGLCILLRAISPTSCPAATGVLWM
ncbi:hypothetical protein QTP70_034521, partial [Hemibagrus guttatus]